MDDHYILYRITANGQENVPLRKPALLVSNHVSMVDAFLVNTPAPTTD